MIGRRAAAAAAGDGREAHRLLCWPRIVIVVLVLVLRDGRAATASTSRWLHAEGHALTRREGVRRRGGARGAADVAREEVAAVGLGFGNTALLTCPSLDEFLNLLQRLDLQAHVAAAADGLLDLRLDSFDALGQLGDLEAEGRRGLV